jgi:hypothetical protein
MEGKRLLLISNSAKRMLFVPRDRPPEAERPKSKKVQEEVLE